LPRSQATQYATFERKRNRLYPDRDRAWLLPAQEVMKKGSSAVSWRFY